MAPRKIDALLANLQRESLPLCALIDDIWSLIAKPLGPHNPTNIARILAAMDARKHSFQRATRALEVELRRSGDFAISRTKCDRKSEPNAAHMVAHRTLRAWEPMREVITRALCQAQEPAFFDGNTGTIQTQSDALAQAFILLDQILNSIDQDESALDLGAYSDIPMLPHKFQALIHTAWRLYAASGLDTPTRFLDVGSGRGTTLLMASRYFDVVRGIEYDPGYHQRAQRLLGAGRTINCASILANAVDYAEYGAYNIIYFYKPMQDSDKLTHMESQIIAQTKPGTLLIAPYHGFAERHAPEFVSKIAGHIYLRNGTEYSAADLNDALRWVGPYVKFPVTEISNHACGYWNPLVHKLATRGFLPRSLE